MLKNESTAKVGIKNKRLTAGLDESYLGFFAQPPKKGNIASKPICSFSVTVHSLGEAQTFSVSFLYLSRSPVTSAQTISSVIDVIETGKRLDVINGRTQR